MVGVVDRALELLVLLLESFLIVAESVVVADLPQHPGVGAYSGCHGDSADQCKNGDPVQNVRGHDKLSELTWRRCDVERIVLTRNHEFGPSGLRTTFELVKSGFSAL